MKQILINDVIEAFGDEPLTIRARLESLGVDDESIGKFSDSLLDVKIYASSFAKFLNENKSKFNVPAMIPAKELPQDFKDPFDEGPTKVSARLKSIGVNDEDAGKLFDQEILNLEVNSKEFEELISQNGDSLFAKINEIAGIGVQDAQ